MCVMLSMKRSYIFSGSTKQVKLTVYVDKESARAMNSGEEKIEDILVLHLEGGKDFFVSLKLIFIIQSQQKT